METARHRLEGTPYVLDRVLGAGAMGEVWLGEHASLRRPAVIKLIHPRYAAEAQVVARMRREARIVANLRHDALVTVYDLGETADGRTYIAMEWLEGSVLRELLRARGALAPAEACSLAIQALDGLQAAHVAGVIHRDVKPENLFVTREGRLKVLDFGVAKPMQEGDLTGARTAAGMVLGTPRYMAPEQAIGRALSAATDVYALGCVLFELCVGRPVFEGTDARDLLYAHVHQAAPSMSTRAGRAFAPALESIVAQALQKEPSRRFASAQAMADALRAFSRAQAAQDPSARATVRVDLAAAASQAVPTAHGEPLTRAVSAQRLLVGTGTTEQSPVALLPRDGSAHDAPTALTALTAHASDIAHTAPTEVLRATPPAPLAAIADDAGAGTQVTYEPISATLGGSGDSALAATTIRSARSRSLTLLIAGASVGAAVAALGLYVVMRGGAGASERGSTRAAEASPTRASASASATFAEERGAQAMASAEPAPIAQKSRTSAASGLAGSVPSVASVPSAIGAAATTATAATASVATATGSAASATASAPTAPAAPVPPSHLELARQAMADGDLDLAEREARLAGGGSAARLLLGEILERRGKTSLARDLYRKILEGDPDNAAAKTRLARLGG